MPICPFCIRGFKTKAKLCDKKVCSSKGKNLHRLIKAIQNNKRKYELTHKIITEAIEKLPLGENITSTDIINQYNLEEHTTGSKYLKILDYYVCLGVLEKIKFSGKGHIYKKINQDVAMKHRCNHMIGRDGKIICNYDWKEAKEKNIEVEEF